LGTRNPSLIPKHLSIQEVDDISNKSVVFYDLELENYRSLTADARVTLMS
jgi:hypothetical protein